MNLFILLQLFVTTFGDVVIPKNVEAGIGIGYNIHDKWEVAYQFQSGLLSNYNYNGLEFCKFFKTSDSLIWLGAGLKAGVYDQYYLNFRPFVRLSQYINPNSSLGVDVTLRGYLPDFTLQWINYFYRL